MGLSSEHLLLPIADSHAGLLLACIHRRERGTADPFLVGANMLDSFRTNLPP